MSQTISECIWNHLNGTIYYDFFSDMFLFWLDYQGFVLQILIFCITFIYLRNIMEDRSILLDRLWSCELTELAGQGVSQMIPFHRLLKWS